MKQLFLLPFAITILSLMFSCKPDPVGPSGEIPDLVINLDFEENGTSFETLNFTYEKQQPGSGETAAANGSYQSITDLFLTQVLGKPGSLGPTFLITGPINGLTAGTYQVSTLDATNPLANAYSSFVTENGDRFTSSSGTFKMSNVELFADVGGSTLQEYFVDIEVNMTMQTDDGTRTITASGSMKGINIKGN
ncbi:MAG: hypothetical protein AAF587_14610 [Bacteroidota bacterium]